MRRPRGPGGRFLTAEEIAAQKLGQQAAPEENAQTILIDSPDPQPSQDQALAQISIESHHAQLPQNRILPAQDACSVGLATTPYNSLSHSNASPPALSPSLSPSFPDNRQGSSAHIAPPISTQPPPVQSRSPILATQSHVSQHPAKTTANASVGLRSPYSPAQMHHVPHPHAHTRLRHSHLNFTDDIYQGGETPQGTSGADNPMMAYSSQNGG